MAKFDDPSENELHQISDALDNGIMAMPEAVFEDYRKRKEELQRQLKQKRNIV